MTQFRLALLQVNASNEMEANIGAVAAMVRQARQGGAQMAMMPENVAMMEWGRPNIIAKALPEAGHPALEAFRVLARGCQMWLHCGTLHIRLGVDRLANRNYVIAPDGRIAARYDKIHMFDVDLGNGERYQESATFEPGTVAATVDLPWGRMGLSVCYDVRFPHLYRALAKAGCQFLAVPAAFTRTSGRAHWHLLLRARAIETGCFVLAPAQCGTHAGERQTFGHSLAVGPWGEVLADGGEEPGITFVDIDPAQVALARAKIPSLVHDRAFKAPVSGGLAADPRS